MRSRGRSDYRAAIAWKFAKRCTSWSTPGEIVRIRKNRARRFRPKPILSLGNRSIHQAGYGFLVPEKAGEPDIFIAAENTGTAMNGDRVVARISRDVPPRRAKVERVRQLNIGAKAASFASSEARARHDCRNTCNNRGTFYYVVPDDPRLVHDVYVQFPPRAKVAENTDA